MKEMSKNRALNKIKGSKDQSNEITDKIAYVNQKKEVKVKINLNIYI